MTTPQKALNHWRATNVPGSRKRKPSVSDHLISCVRQSARLAQSCGFRGTQRDALILSILCLEVRRLLAIVNAYAQDGSIIPGGTKRSNKSGKTAPPPCPTSTITSGRVITLASLREPTTRAR